MMCAPGRPKRVTLCATCNDEGYVLRHPHTAGGGVRVEIADACPDCLRRAEHMFRWMQEAREMRRGAERRPA